ncbi:MAG: PIN domain-containing protein [Deltaproteobacteria bacterium]|nr:PIN domain-containing protein [Deltaproteobacteria bacterium]
MPAVVADTHALVWYLLDRGRLSTDALAALDAAAVSGDPVWISAVTLVELTYLVEKGRLPAIVKERVEAEIGRPDVALAVAPLDQEVARLVSQVPRGDVPDMPDRIIAATALALALPLVSRDRRIRASAIHTIW